MKSTNQKRRFIELRAEGRSYSFIAGELHIAKATCTSWERELASEIAELKREELAELYESFSMSKEARIKKLGQTLGQIEEALKAADFSTVDPAKLLDYKLKYTEALKGEYVSTTPAPELDALDAQSILKALSDLLARVRAGEVTTEQAQRESTVLSNLLKAFDTVEVKAKLEEIEAMLADKENT